MLQSHQKWNMEYYKLVEFCQIWMSSPLYKRKSPPHKRKDPYWRLSGDGSGFIAEYALRWNLPRTCEILIQTNLSQKYSNCYSPFVLLIIAINLHEEMKLLYLQTSEVFFQDLPVDFLDCEGLRSHALLIGLSFPIFLLLVCSVYAFRIRKVPQGFNEAKHIGFAVYTTLVIWLAQVTSLFDNYEVVWIAKMHLAKSRWAARRRYSLLLVLFSLCKCSTVCKIDSGVVEIIYELIRWRLLLGKVVHVCLRKRQKPVHIFKKNSF